MKGRKYKRNMEKVSSQHTEASFSTFAHLQEFLPATNCQGKVKVSADLKKIKTDIEKIFDKKIR